MKASPTEIMRADPIARRRAIIVLIVLGAACLVSFLLTLRYGDPVEAWWTGHLRKIEELRGIDPAAANAVIDRSVRALLIALWTMGALATAGCLWYGRKLWRADQWPAAGAKLIAGRPIVRGRPLRIIGVTLSCVGVLVFLAFAYVTWRLSSIMLWHQ
jgi:hypothetical protein